MTQVCHEYGLGVIPYSPLAAGFLTGKYRPGLEPKSVRQGRASRYSNEHNWNFLNNMEEIGQAMGGASIAQVALAWLLHNRLITSPIIGPRTLEQLKDNLGAINLSLSEEQKNILDEASR